MEAGLMPVRRREVPTIFERSMSRSKQLGGFQTSGAFEFRQKHTHSRRRQASCHATHSNALEVREALDVVRVSKRRCQTRVRKQGAYQLPRVVGAAC